MNPDLIETLTGDLTQGKNLVLKLTTSDRLKQDNIDIVKTMADMGYHVIIITTNQPSEVLKKNYEKSWDRSLQTFFHRRNHQLCDRDNTSWSNDVRFIGSPVKPDRYWELQ